MGPTPGGKHVVEGADGVVDEGGCTLRLQCQLGEQSDEILSIAQVDGFGLQPVAAVMPGTASAWTPWRRRWSSPGRPIALRLTMTQVPPAASTASWPRRMSSIPPVMLKAYMTLRPLHAA